MERTYKRGDMYYADLGKGIGSEQEGYRPVLIIQNNTGNRHSTTVIVASISSKVDAKPKLPTHYFIDAECGLQLPSIVLLEQLRTVSKQRLEGYVGRLDKKTYPWRQPCAGGQHRSYLPRPKQASALLMQNLCGQFLQHRCLHPAKA